mmetsp:Transcript_9879/g.29851  ORF Transcript_9879/g.29851 Transcript_9879/m.29851 type:complete len:256 (+) Transcript_9879:194-961(+)
MPGGPPRQQMMYQQQPPPGAYGGPPPRGPPPGAYGAPPPGGPPPGAYGAPPAGYGAPPGGGYGYPGAPPAGAPGIAPPGFGGAPDPLWQHFMAVAGGDGVLGPDELQRCLTATGMSGYPRPGGEFSLETCRVIIALLDKRRTMTMDFEGFKQVHHALEAWKASFREHDADQSGTVEHHELKTIFSKMGFNISDGATDVCIKRYSKTASNQLNFDDFICCAVRLRAYSEAFKARDMAKQGTATFQFDDFIQLTMRL